MGGVINIITKKQDQEGFHGNAPNAGSYNTKNTWVPEVSATTSSALCFGRPRPDRRPSNHSDFDLTNAYLKLGYEISKTFRPGPISA
jgi:iron complex outermembrane receptor protein